MLASGAPLAAQRSDSVAVIEAAQTALRAISTRDTALARTVFLPGVQLIAVMDPAPPTASPRMQSDTTFYRTLPGGKEKLLERMWSPTVLLFGSVAQVHAPYDFFVDGTFSHCGTDVFMLVRAKGEWRISSITYTAQRSGCAPSPLGPPGR
ncbi:MAG: nuclear transport factor 2 family protein [Gemmatimonadaceae bacterium]|nr:nuclear transport factor 2 family protein [Gemmatimonadaceae bacterium]